MNNNTDFIGIDGLLGLAFGSINTVTPGPAQTPVQVCANSYPKPK